MTPYALARPSSTSNDQYRDGGRGTRLSPKAGLYKIRHPSLTLNRNKCTDPSKCGPSRSQDFLTSVRQRSSLTSGFAGRSRADSTPCDTLCISAGCSGPETCVAAVLFAVTLDDLNSKSMPGKMVADSHQVVASSPSSSLPARCASMNAVSMSSADSRSCRGSPLGSQA